MLIQQKFIGTIARMWADNTYSLFTDSLVDLVAYSYKHLCSFNEDIKYDKAYASYHELARNQIVEDTKGDWTLMLDTDHCFSPDLLVRMLNLMHRYDLQVLSGAYCYKSPPHLPVVNMWTQDNKVTPLLDWDRNVEVIEVGPVPGGCLLINNNVFKRIKKELNEEPFTKIPGISEDYSFCSRCKTLKIPIYFAPKIESHHIIKSLLYIEDHLPHTPITNATSTNGQILDIKD